MWSEAFMLRKRLLAIVLSYSPDERAGQACVTLCVHGRVEMLHSLATPRQLLAIAPVCGWDVDVHRLERRPASVTDLMGITLLDEQEGAFAKRFPSSVDDPRAATGHDEQPLIGAAMTVIRSALTIPWRNDHLRGLSTRIADGDAKSLPKAKLFLTHGAIG
jgi:hypothetical protein